MSKKHYVVVTTNGVSIDVYADYVRHDSRVNKDAIIFCNSGKSDIVLCQVAEFYLDAIAGYIDMDRMGS